MPQTFMVKLRDIQTRRIVLDKEAVEKEKIKEGDWVKVTIENTEK